MTFKNKIMAFWYNITRGGFKLLFWLFAKIEITGWENIPATGPLIIAVNHLTVIEPPLIYALMPFKKMTALVADKWDKIFLIGPLMRSLDSIFVNREQIDRHAIQAMIKVLKGGGVLGMAPEGTRSRTGGLIQAKPGVAYVATKTNTPVLPIGISGQRNWQQQLKRLKRVHLRVNIGELIYLPIRTGVNKTAYLQACVDTLMIDLARLIEPELRGFYAPYVEEKRFE